MSGKRLFVDTNIFLRYITNDDIKAADEIEKILRKAIKGKVYLVTSSLVIAELVWVLESYYEHPKDEVEVMVTGILNTKGLEVEESDMLLRALDMYVSKNIDFADAFNAEFMKKRGLERILTLDKKHFSRIDDIVIENF